MKPKDLPKRYQSRFINNCKDLTLFRKTQIELEDSDDYLSLSTVDAFSWSDSEEGHHFWSTVRDARNEKELPGLPLFEVSVNSSKKTAKTHSMSYKVNGIRRSIAFQISNISNCGMAMVHGFCFPHSTPKDEDFYVFEQMIVQLGCHPYYMATHNQNKRRWFRNWKSVEEFENPNSSNDISIYKIERGKPPIVNDKYDVERDKNGVHIITKKGENKDEDDKNTDTDTITTVEPDLVPV